MRALRSLAVPSDAMARRRGRITAQHGTASHHVPTDPLLAVATNLTNEHAQGACRSRSSRGGATAACAASTRPPTRRTATTARSASTGKGEEEEEDEDEDEDERARRRRCMSTYLPACKAGSTLR